MLDWELGGKYREGKGRTLGFKTGGFGVSIGATDAGGLGRTKDPNGGTRQSW